MSVTEIEFGVEEMMLQYSSFQSDFGNISLGLNTYGTRAAQRMLVC